MSYSDMLGLRQIEPAMMEVCLAIESNAVLLAPVAEEDGGAFRNSISIATELREEGFNSRDGISAPSSAKIEQPPLSDGTTAYVGSGIVYAPPIEFGRPDMPNYPAQPTLRPAAMMVKSKLDGTFSKEMRNSIKNWISSQRYIQRKGAMQRQLKYEQGGGK